MDYVLDLKIGDVVYDEFLYPTLPIEVIDIDGFFIVVKDPINGKDRIYCWTIDKKTGNIDFPENLSKTPYTITGRTSCYKLADNNIEIKSCRLTNVGADTPL